MKQPAIDLHIGELILIDSSGRRPYAQRQRIAAAAEQELVRLLAERGLPPVLAQGGHVPRISVDNIHIASGARVSAIGAQIAQAVYGHLAGGDRQG
jgi:hypothetical protein